MVTLLKEDLALLEKVLRVGVANTKAPADTKSGADAFLALPDLTKELEAEAAGSADAEAHWTAHWATIGNRRSLVDRALFGRLSGSQARAFDYLLGVYRRCEEARGRFSSATPAATAEVHAHVSELCVSYASLALTTPSMFNESAADDEGVTALVRALRLDGTESTGALPTGFFSKLVAQLIAQEEGALAQVATPLFDKLSEAAQTLSLDGDFTPLYRAMLAVAREKPLGALLTQHPRWLPMAPTGALLESSSLLGRFVGLSALNSDDTKAAAEVFGDPTNAAGVENTMVSVRAGVGLAQRALAAICKELFKNSDAKEGLFKYIAAACTLNQLRAQQYYQQSSEHARVRRPLLPAFMQAMEEQAPAARMASSEGFLVNLTSVLLGLCDPFTAPGSPHAAKIDSTYLLSKARLNLAGETRLCATEAEAAHWLDPSDATKRKRYDDERGEGAAAGEGGDPLVISSSFGTISEYFFLTMRLLHVGVLPVFPVLKEITRECQQIEEHSDRIEQQLAGLGNHPQAGQLAATRDAFRGFATDLRKLTHAYRALVCEPELLRVMFRYYRLVARWLVACAKPPPTGLPLAPTPPRLFAMLPEFCMEDVANFIQNLVTGSPHFFLELQPTELDDLLTLIVTFLAEKNYVKSVGLRAHFTELLRFLVPLDGSESRHGPHAPERIAAVFHSHELAKRHLAPAIMQFFVEVEHGLTSHYEKYTYRVKMTKTLGWLWQQPEYKASMIGFVREHAKMVKFVNMLLNDSIYAMDETLSKLQEIRTFQTEEERDPELRRRRDRATQDRLRHHGQNENHCAHFMNVTKEILGTLVYLTAEREVSLVFMLPELVMRVSQMLNYFLEKLVGKEQGTLKVREPEKYDFSPKLLLHTICTLINNCAVHADFASAVVRDERSYKADNIRKAVRVLSTGAPPLLLPADLEKLAAFAGRCEAQKDAERAEEEEMGEVPDEFQDPITAELMTDPVRLPSGHVVDRSVIQRHLLSDENDPFSRAKLTVDMLVPDAELKEKIDEWRASKRRASAEGAMDTS